MQVRDPRSADRRKKEKEWKMIEEGTALYRQKRLREAVEKREEQRRLHAMIANYHPWGKPGGGAPNLQIRRRPMSLTQVETQKGLDYSLPRVGQKPPVIRRSDPLLRYQFQESVRKSIDNHVRYRRPYHEKVQYKQQLDRLVADKRQQLAEERRENRDLVDMTGWTGEPMFQRLEYQNAVQDERRGHTPKYPMITQHPHTEVSRRRDIYPQEEVLTGGVELVPLLARRRAGYKLRELPTTDITKLTKLCPIPKPVWKPAANEGEYLRELTSQIITKEMQIREAKTEDMLKSRRHFETWGGFWGRPGHGAPKETIAKENLDNLLYHMPIATM